MSENNSPTPPVGPTPPGYNSPEPTGPIPYQQPGYGQPAQQAPAQYQQPTAAPQYPQTPAQQPYPQTQSQQYQQGAVDPAGTVVLNYWLSVFFSWIPALIFFLTEKGKNSFADDFHRQNLNFSILRVIAFVLTFIPYLGVIFGIAGVALFIIHIIAAVNAPNQFRNGQTYKFPFNVAFIK
ncbi:hypothetical protein AS189_14910 [Arthrobacter alpinus]|uniref:DUF4870 domain-containing protein n=1 Tax=Arthrobacter alpinus TaxID=656366 RepID=A0A0S2M2A6_9MICC|nr:DUF4870 domain-containing protein [Arthrobacter alpinus]ALO67543.1 hypothetical protein AS189_14910 [Arthrobacter alpinus]